jgi:hypothetical protein
MKIEVKRGTNVKQARSKVGCCGLILKGLHGASSVFFVTGAVRTHNPA